MLFQVAAAAADAAVPYPPVRSYRLSTAVAAAPLTPLQELHLKQAVLRRWNLLRLAGVQLVVAAAEQGQ